MKQLCGRVAREDVRANFSSFLTFQNVSKMHFKIKAWAHYKLKDFTLIYKEPQISHVWINDFPRSRARRGRAQQPISRWFHYCLYKKRENLCCEKPYF
jgi:hypothetical protein